MPAVGRLWLSDDNDDDGDNDDDFDDDYDVDNVDGYENDLGYYCGSISFVYTEIGANQFRSGVVYYF